MAAAFAALVSLQNNLALIQNHPRHSFSFEEEQLHSLGGCVGFLIDFMESFDDAHGARKEAAAALEMRIARAAQAAEDVVESHVVDQIRSGKTKSKTFPSSRYLLDVHKAIEGLSFMCRKAMNVKVRSGMEAEQQQQPPANLAAAAAATTTATTYAGTAIAGFDGILLELLAALTREPSSRLVIPIVGMGGVGKTTLATHAFKHPLIVEHFDVCLWATVSLRYEVKKILAQLMSGLRKSSIGGADESCSYRSSSEELYKSLYGRRYLIMLDDMWSVEAWDALRFLFPDTNNGSRIVVTTRDSNVAGHLGISWLRVCCLDEDKSWLLFCQRAFEAEQGCPSQLEQIGRKIVEKCKGLPLAIVVVSGHLRKSSMTLDYWENVAQHMNSILSYTDHEEQCLSVLSLSYSYLPVHLKPCFLLMGAYQEDESINAADVFSFWIAEGFIESYENTFLEVVAKGYLWDLCERNLILIDEVGFDGDILHVKLHDLVREMCQKIAKKEEFLSVTEALQLQAIDKERRVVINGKTDVEVNHGAKSCDAPIRCLIYQGGWLIYNMKLLRTLSKVVASSMSPSSFEHVLNLRALSVDLIHKRSRSLYLPSSISLLWNLQILTIDLPLQSVVIAPYEIWEMLQLRHLEVDPICLLDPLPTDNSSDQEHDLILRNLQKLMNVENFRLSEEVCKRIPNIRELELSYCDEAMLYYCPHNLVNFHNLDTLTLHFRGDSKWRDFSLSFTFPASLQWLYLVGCGVDWEELAMMAGSLPNLTGLCLFENSVIGSVWNPVEGNFLRLECLDIRGCDDLVNLNADYFHFPVLRHLRLKDLSKLHELPSGIGEIPTLQVIKVEYCSESASISAMRILVEQEELGNEGLELLVRFESDEETLESFNNKVPQELLTSNNMFLHLKHVKPNKK